MCKVKNSTINSNPQRVISTKNVGFQSVNAKKHTNNRTLLDKLELLDETNTTHKAFFTKFRKRAYAKYRTNQIVQGLCSLNNIRKAKYERTYSCGTAIKQEGNKFTSTYCGCRWCIVCSRNKTGKLINRYLKTMRKSRDWYHVTLTLKSVADKELRKTNKAMFDIFAKIMRRIRYRNNVKATRSLECTYSIKRNDYHPHIHVLITGKENAQYLKENWIKEVSNYFGVDMEGIDSEVCRHYLQKIVRVRNTAKSLMEVLKYPTNHIDDKGNEIPSHALDIIYHSLENLRTFQVYGMKAFDDKIEYQQTETETENPHKYEFALWIWRGHDWINFLGVAMSGYIPKCRNSKIEQNST